jgi:hypothetical protein
MVRLCHEHEVEVEHGRWLYPCRRGLAGWNYRDIFDPKFYWQTIDRLIHEANGLGADGTALDTEPYANSPLKAARRDWDSFAERAMQEAVQAAVDDGAWVDTLMPARAKPEDGASIYNATTPLGNVLAKYTYWYWGAKYVPPLATRPFSMPSIYVTPDGKHPGGSTRQTWTWKLLQDELACPWLQDYDEVAIYPGDFDNQIAIAEQLINLS